MLGVSVLVELAIRTCLNITQNTNAKANKVMKVRQYAGAEFRTVCNASEQATEVGDNSTSWEEYTPAQQQYGSVDSSQQ